MCGCTSTPCGCETPNIPRGPRGFAGPAGPAPNIEIGLVTTGAPGSPAAASITGTSPNLTLNLTIPEGDTGPVGPAGTNGTNGIPAYTNLVLGFTQPAIGSATASPVEVGTTAWMAQGEWVYVGAGGYYVVQTIHSPTTVTLRNPGAADGFATGVPGNAGVGLLVGVTGAAAQVTPGGRPGTNGSTGPTGPTGNPGQDAFIQVVNTIPVAAPPPGEEFKIYTDSSTNPTVITGYSWNGVSWVATANLTPVAGSQIYQTVGVPLAGLGKNGDWAFDSGTLAVYYKSAGTWTNPFNLSATFTQVATASSGNMGTVPVRTPRIVGFDPTTATISSPITYTMDLQYQGFSIEADKNIVIDWDDTNFTYSGLWELQVKNTDGGSPITLTLAAGKFAENASLALTTTISLASLATRVFILRKNAAGDRLIIENTYLVNNL